MRWMMPTALTLIATIGSVASLSIYSFVTVDRLQDNVETVNEFYIPTLKHLNLLSGKWSAYQRSYEQAVAFRKWGAGSSENLSFKLHLGRMIEPNVLELSQRLDKLPASRFISERVRLREFLGKLRTIAEQDPTRLAELEALVKSKHFIEAAQTYSRVRQAHLALSQELLALNRACEHSLVVLQMNTQEQLRSSQAIVLVLLGFSLVFFVVSWFRLRRWMLPILDWTRVAHEISLKGLHEQVKFPQVSSEMPSQISLLTREFTRMGTNILERERTIHQQKSKLEALNSHLTEQNEILKKLGGLNERVLNSMSSGLLVVAENGTIEQFNERFCGLFENSRSDLFGRKISDLLPFKGDELLLETLKSSESVYLKRHSISRRVFDIRVTPLIAQAGKLVIFEEVTDLVEAEEKLEHARKLVLAGNLSSQVAHEVRNPLNSMSLQIEMLQEDLTQASLPSGVLGRVRAIDEQIHRLERIAEKYLDVHPKLLQKKDQFDLHDLIEKCTSFMVAEIQSAKVQILMALDAKQSVVLGDADALGQVFFNLIRNSIEAMSEMPQDKLRQLKFSTRNEQGSICCTVIDSGPGIQNKVQGKIFEPFVTHKATGHGLGLSVSRQICIEHGGELQWLKDRPTGESRQGACFELKIPLLAENKEQIKREHKNVSATDLNC